jgi:gamma-glutamylcyclotransferase (GGCT)/AIG2-like uncharacterized protein YtfP
MRVAALRKSDDRRAMAKTSYVNLFAYGTLMFPEVWERVVGIRSVGEPATLVGYVVRRAADDVYPVLIRGEEHDRVAGLVFRDIDEQTLAKLDAYESDLYDRIAVSVVLESGEALECQAYVLPARLRRNASGEAWNRKEFAAHALNEYIDRLK